jgi:surface protein
MAVGSFRLPISAGGAPAEEWTRPSDWLAMPTPAAQTFVGLFAVFPNSGNFIAFSFTTSSGTYYVDWGDGTNSTVTSGTQTNKSYDYATYDVGDTTLCSRGYKQVIITVTPSSANLTGANFQLRHTGQNVTYSTHFLDCILQLPNCTTTGLTLGGSTVRHGMCERFEILSIGSLNTLANRFQNFTSLQSVPLFNTASVTTMVNMFSSSASLKSVPLFNTANVTNMQSMFSTCNALQSVPLFNTANVTNMASMFNTCNALQSVPLFNTASVTTMASMFQSCLSLKSVPLFNTASVTDMSAMFNGCSALKSIPAFNTSAITPLAGTDYGTSFAVTCNSLENVEITFARTVTLSNCQLSKAELETIFANLITRPTTNATINVTGNYGLDTAISRSFTTTSGSTTITTANTASLAVGMQVVGTGSPLTTATAVTFQDTGDTVTLVAHGLENGDEVSFPNITTTTGISRNTIYFVVNKTADTFQVATTAGGSALPLTTDGTGTLLHRTEIVSIVTNVSITMSRPMRATGANTLAFRQIRTGTALLKNWVVTG